MSEVLPSEANKSRVSSEGSTLNLWLGEATTNSIKERSSENTNGHTGFISFKVRQGSSFQSQQHQNADIVKIERLRSAKIIQRWYRKVEMDYSRWQYKSKMQRTKEGLASKMEQIDDGHIQQAVEIEGKLRALTPQYLHWLIRSRGVHFIAPERHMEIEGVVAFVDMKGFTNLAQYLARKNAARKNSSAFLDENMNFNLSSELTNEVLTRYWELVIMYAQKFQGDVLKFLGDAVQIIFPLEPLFSHEVDVETARRKCQNRGLMFTLELLRALEFFEIDSFDLGTNRMSLKIGLAYGLMDIRILGGVSSRCELVLSGPTSEVAATLSGKAGHDEAVVHKSILFVIENHKRVDKNKDYVRLRGGKKNSMGELYRLLTETEDYFEASLFQNPFEASLGETGNSAANLFENVRALNRFQTLVANRAKERRKSYSSVGSLNSYSRLSSTRMIRDLEDSITAPRGSTTNESLLSGDLPFSTLGRFVPQCALSQIEVGCATSTLGQGFCSVLFVEVCNYDPNMAPEDQTRFMQIVTTLAQTAIYEELGDLRQVAVDDKGLVVIGMFGIGSPNAEEAAFAAAKQILQRYKANGIAAGLGLASGACHFGPTGAAGRNEYAVVGSTVNLAARLMARVSQATIHDSHNSYLLIDQNTFLGLSRHCQDDFITSEIKVKGFDAPIQVFLPLSRNNTLKDLEEAQVLKALSFESAPRKVKVSQVTDRSKMSFRERQRRLGFVADIQRLTLGLERPESVQEVLKHITVMGVVNPRVDSAVLYSIIPSVTVCADLSYSLEIIESEFQIIRDVGNQVYMINNIEQHIKPLYETLMQSFRKRLHEELAQLYEEQLLHGNIKDIANDSLHVIIGSHYALAGVDHHLKAADFLNQGLAKVARQDLAYASVLARRSRRLVTAWQRKQHGRAEKAAATSMYFIGSCELKMGSFEKGFGAYVASLRCYSGLEGILCPPCQSQDNCFLHNDSYELCSCLKLRPNLHAYLITHHTEEAHSLSLYTFGMEIKTVDGLTCELTPVECAIKGNVNHSQGSTTCMLESLSSEEMDSRYQLADRKKNISTYYSLYIPEAQTAKLILHTFAQLAKVTAKAEMKAQGQLRSVSRTNTQDILGNSDPSNKNTPPQSKLCSIQ